jgi:hypothetical protein
MLPLRGWPINIDRRLMASDDLATLSPALTRLRYGVIRQRLASRRAEAGKSSANYDRRSVREATGSCDRFDEPETLPSSMAVCIWMLDIAPAASGTGEEVPCPNYVCNAWKSGFNLPCEPWSSDDDQEIRWMTMRFQRPCCTVAGGVTPDGASPFARYHDRPRCLYNPVHNHVPNDCHCRLEC